MYFDNKTPENLHVTTDKSISDIINILFNYEIITLPTDFQITKLG